MSSLTDVEQVSAGQHLADGVTVLSVHRLPIPVPVVVGVPHVRKRWLQWRLDWVASEVGEHQ